MDSLEDCFRSPLGRLPMITVSESAEDNCLRWPPLFVEFDDKAFCLCPAAKCVSGMALL